jgi:hypothetical protein
LDNWAPEFNSLLNSALGKELMRSLKEDLHESLIRKAQGAENSDNAFGLLKEASGVMLAMEHMMFLSSVPIDEDSKV